MKLEGRFAQKTVRFEGRVAQKTVKLEGRVAQRTLQLQGIVGQITVILQGRIAQNEGQLHCHFGQSSQSTGTATELQALTCEQVCVDYLGGMFDLMRVKYARARSNKLQLQLQVLLCQLIFR